jgi:hypothetical protein
MEQHKNKAKRTFKHGIASYPLYWKEYFLSEDKICIHFKEVQMKTRTNVEGEEDLRTTQWGSKELPIDTQNTNISFLAIGIPIELHKELLQQLLKAYKEHVDKFNNKHELKEYLLNYANKIKALFAGENV